MKKFEKKSSKASNKDTDAEDSYKEFNHSEESDDERKAKKDYPFRLDVCGADLKLNSKCDQGLVGRMVS